jgi:hypothetical protein
MTKKILMLLGFTVVLSAAVACFSPSSKKDKTSPINIQTNSVSEPPSSH